jgi:putative transcriptional regulator
MLEPAPGHLLVASPLLEDPNFARTVVLIGDHTDEGTFGLVLNRPLGLDPGDEMPQWSRLLAPPRTVFSGGPVSPEAGRARAAGRSTGRSGW